MGRGRSRRITALIAGAALALALLAVGIMAVARHNIASPLQVGTSAPTFSLPALDGGSISLAELHGHALLINFWASWCPYCRAETESLVTLQTSCHDLTVLGVAVDAPPERVAQFANHAGIGYPVLLDPTGEVANLYGATYLPTSVLVSPTGRIAWIDHGVFITGGEARSLVDRHLGGICLPDNTSHS